MAEEIGFAGVMAGPMVRSSYRAGRLWARAMRKNGYPIPENLAHIEGEGAAPAGSLLPGGCGLLSLFRIFLRALRLLEPGVRPVFGEPPLMPRPLCG